MASGTLRILPCVAHALLRAGPRGHPRLSGTQAKLNVSSSGSFRLRRFLFLSLYSLMAVAGALLGIRLVVGPLRSRLVTVNSRTHSCVPGPEGTPDFPGLKLNYTSQALGASVCAVSSSYRCTP